MLSVYLTEQALRGKTYFTHLRHFRGEGCTQACTSSGKRKQSIIFLVELNGASGDNCVRNDGWSACSSSRRVRFQDACKCSLHSACGGSRSGGIIPASVNKRYPSAVLRLQRGTHAQTVPLHHHVAIDLVVLQRKPNAGPTCKSRNQHVECTSRMRNKTESRSAHLDVISAPFGRGTAAAV